MGQSEGKRRQIFIEEYLQVLTAHLGEASISQSKELINLAQQVRYSDAKEERRIWEMALLAAKKEKNDSVDRGEILHGIAELDHRQKQYESAAQFYEQAAEAWKGIEGLSKQKIPFSLLDAVSDYLKAGSIASAERCFRASLNEARSHTGYRLATVAEEFGSYYLRMRQPSPAVQKLEIAVAASEALPSKPESYRMALMHLGEAYQLNGQFAEANAVNQRFMTESLADVKSATGNPLLLRGLWIALAIVAGGLALALVGYWFSSRRIDRGVQALFDVVVVEAPEAPAGEEVQELEIVSPPEAPPINRFVFHGAGPDLFAMRILHLLLTIATFGVFSFWGKIRVRRYLCSQAEFLGDRFGFHGTGGELLRGWLKGAPLLAMIFLFPRIAPIFWGQVYSLAAIQILAVLALLVLWPIARAGAFRYRMNRMSWRGIRFRFHGGTAQYFWISILGYLGILFSFGLYTAKLAMAQRAYLFSQSSIGDRQFAFSGKSSRLFWAWFFTIPLTIGSCGLFWFWWSALRSRYNWAHTTLGEARFRCRATGASLAWLTISNALLFVFTLGIGSSWAALRSVRYWTERIELVGPLSPDEIRQTLGDSSALGESFADFIGFDFGF